MPDEQFAHVHRVKSVDILIGTNVPNNNVRIHVFGQRHLHQDAVHVGIRIQAINQRQQLVLRRVHRQSKRFSRHTRDLRSFLFCANIDRAGGVVANQHDGKSRRGAARNKLGNVARYFLANSGGDGRPADELSGQNQPTLFRG